MVVIVVGDEILDRIVREEAFELGIELGGERLVVGEDQRGALGGLDDLGHGEGLARAGDAEQHLILLAFIDALDQFGNGLGLIAGRVIVRLNAEGDPAFGFFPVSLGPVRRPDGGMRLACRNKGGPWRF